MNRRSFVQFCVGAAAAGAATASAFSMAKPLAIPRLGGSVQVQYVGAERVAGPAPRGMPLIPIFLNADGVFEGKPTIKDLDGEDVNILEWYKYCGHQAAPGLRPEYPADQNALKYFIAEEKIAVVKPWYENLLDKTVKPADFPDVEFGAGFVWRSERQAGPNVLSGIVIRYPKEAMVHVKANATAPAKPIPDEETYKWIHESFFVEEGDSVYIAMSSFCTHFCCIPGYREAEKLARPRNAWDKVFCTCHNSVYDGRRPVLYTFYPDPVAESAEDAAGAAAGGGGH